jgi:hypothetical protein
MKLLVSVAGSQPWTIGQREPRECWTLDDISEKLRDIDFAILMTDTETGGRSITCDVSCAHS